MPVRSLPEQPTGRRRQSVGRRYPCKLRRISFPEIPGRLSAPASRRTRRRATMGRYALKRGCKLPAQRYGQRNSIESAIRGCRGKITDFDDQTKRLSKPASTKPPSSIDQSPVSKPRSRPSLVRRNVVSRSIGRAFVICWVASCGSLFFGLLFLSP
jgi:hypothetical protein